MKKIAILTACFSMLLAEEPAATPPSELQAKQEIESFLEAEPQQEVAVQELQVAPPALPDEQTQEALIVPTQAVELSTDSPVISMAQIQDAKPVATPAPAIVEQIVLDPEEDIAAIEKEEKEVAEEVKSDGIVIDLGQVFAGSPTIYTVLFGLSIASVGIWAYALLNLRTSEILPADQIKDVRDRLVNKHYDEALTLCEKNPSILFQMVSTGILSRGQGQTAMLELMKSDGRRASHSLWQKISLLNDIAVIAPMIGLLGTVLGMFYAFYDLNRSMESISALFDGLGISVGTTVGGLIVAILALMFHSITKYQMTRQLAMVEDQAHSLAHLIDNQG